MTMMPGLMRNICAMLGIVFFTGVAMASEKVTRETAYFAGGCFWCMQEPFDTTEGVIETTVGYMGGTKSNPTYEEVSNGTTGHLEAIRVVYDPQKVPYEKLLGVFWRQIDPTDAKGQFADKGSQYHSAVFFTSPAQQKAAERSKAMLGKSGLFSAPIVTAVLPAPTFYTAENYHQKYYQKQAARYEAYAEGSGRKAFQKKTWSTIDQEHICPLPFRKPDPAALRGKLTPEQFAVTQQNATERPFANTFWDNKKPGIYVDLVSGEALFSSNDKFDSGTGWPSFVKPIEESNVVTHTDNDYGMTRTEVRSKHGDSHLGHIFDDGPAPTGKRYCINSAALRFIPAEDLEKEGYPEYKGMFSGSTKGKNQSK